MPDQMMQVMDYSNYCLVQFRLQPSTAQPSPGQLSWRLSCPKFRLLVVCCLSNFCSDLITAKLKPKPGQDRPNQTTTGQARPHQTLPDHTDYTKPGQTQPDQVRSVTANLKPKPGQDRVNKSSPDQTIPHQTTPDKTRPHKAKQGQVSSSHTSSPRAELSTVEHRLVQIYDQYFSYTTTINM